MTYRDNEVQILFGRNAPYCYIDFIDPEMCGIIINQAKEYMK